MEYFKILTQSNNNIERFSDKYKMKFERMIVSKSGYCFGISYTPNHYSKFLVQNGIVDLFIKESIKQLLMNNWRFEQLLEYSDELQMDIVDCTVNNIELDELLEDETLSREHLLDYLIDNENEIMKMKFRTKEQYLVILMNNGVIGVDEELIEEDSLVVPRLLDFVSYGKVF